MPFDLSSPWLAVGSAFVLGALSGIVPTGAAEGTAVAIGLVRPPQLSLLMWLAFTLGHVAAKLPWYWLGTRADRVTGVRSARWVARTREMLAERPGYGFGVLALSAVTSVPPFHLASIAAGITRIAIVPFVLACLGGRLVRFGVLAAVPGLVRGVLG